MAFPLVLVPALLSILKKKPKAVSTAFQQHNINAQPTPRNLGNALKVFGPKLLQAILSQIQPGTAFDGDGISEDEYDEISNAIGDPTKIQQVADKLAKIGIGVGVASRIISGGRPPLALGTPPFVPYGYGQPRMNYYGYTHPMYAPGYLGSQSAYIDPRLYSGGYNDEPEYLPPPAPLSFFASNKRLLIILAALAVVYYLVHNKKL